MENSVFNNAYLPEKVLHLEIIKNVDDYWPEGLTFRDVFILQMPVTQKLLNHLEEFNTRPVPAWMYLAYPEAKKLLKNRDPLMVIHMDLSKIMKLENQLNPNTVPYPFNMWLKQIADAKSEFENIKILKKDKIAYTVSGDYCNATLTYTMSANFPFEQPIIDGHFLIGWLLDGILIIRQTLKIYCERYAGHIKTFEPLFEYISSLCLPGARVILIGDNGDPIEMNEMQQLKIIQVKYLEIFCKTLPSSFEMDALYVEVLIDIDKFDLYPHKIDILPRDLGLIANEEFWKQENTLEQNLYDCIIGHEPMFE
uniref:Uncharacterized protein n=1 Tax=Panagrolaimus superbus TaxID=310955 RepID=A0A914Y4K0_9BILA